MTITINSRPGFDEFLAAHKATAEEIVRLRWDTPQDIFIGGLNDLKIASANPPDCWAHLLLGVAFEEAKAKG